MSKRKNLTPGLVAALASGATLSPDLKAEHEAQLRAEQEEADRVTAAAAAAAGATGAAATETTATGATGTTAATPAAGATGAETNAGETEEQKQARLATEAAAATAAKAAPAGESALIAHLKEEATGLRNANSELTVKHSQASTALATAQADVTSLVAIVREAATRLCIPMNVTPIALESLSPTALCDYFNKLNGEFKAKFKIGAQADTGAEVDNGGSGKDTKASSKVEGETHLTHARSRAAAVSK